MKVKDKYKVHSPSSRRTLMRREDSASSHGHELLDVVQIQQGFMNID